MLIALSKLMSLRATTPDGTHLTIVDAFFDPRTGALRFLVLDAGSWFTEIDVLIALREMGEIDITAGEWRTGLTRETIEAAPRWTDRAAEMTGLALEHWPSLVVGPFGATYAPMAAEAQLFAQHDAGSPRISKLGGLETVSEWLGLSAFGGDGEIGRVSDFVVDGTSHVMSHVVIEAGGPLSRTHHALPFSDLRYRAEGGGHAVFHADHAMLAKAPTPESLCQNG